jgi:hypothetical protein
VTNVPELSQVAYVMGGLLVLLGLFGLLAPGALREAALAFPRRRRLAQAMTGVALGWSAWMILQANLGRFDGWKPAIYVVAPVLFYLLITYLDELLAARSLGGLLLLAANPALYAARLWEGESPWRLVVTVLAYVAVILGIVLVMSPYRFRHGVLALGGTDARCRVSSFVFLLLGGSVVALGYAVYG